MAYAKASVAFLLTVFLIAVEFKSASWMLGVEIPITSGIAGAALWQGFYATFVARERGL